MSSSICLLSGTDIREGDRIVAVLSTPRSRPSAMFEEYAPVDPYHAASAASFPIRGVHGMFGSFDPDPWQAAVGYLCAAVGTQDWRDVVRMLHEEGLGIEIDDPGSMKKKRVRRPAAFAFVHEDMHDAVLETLGIRLDPSPAVEKILDLADVVVRSERGSDDRGLAVMQLLAFSRTGLPFGTGQLVSSASDDRIGEEILSRTIDRFCRSVLDGGSGRTDEMAEEATRMFGCLADVTLFETVLNVAGVAFQPSKVGSVFHDVRARIALMTMDRILPKTIEKDVENDEPTPFLDALRDLSVRLDAARSEHERAVDAMPS